MKKAGRATVGVVGLALSVLFMQASSSYPSGKSDGDYEISLHELGKAKKSLPQKRKPSERGKRKQADAVSGKPSAVQPRTGEAQAEKILISHDPYSYVVAGKQTVILAVISGQDDIKAVSCRFRGEEKGDDSAVTAVTMTKVEGTHFTYRAILPGLAPDSRFLHYRLVAVDTQGREIQSREFSTAVRTSTVVPGWQLEESPEAPKDGHPVSGKAP